MTTITFGSPEAKRIADESRALSVAVPCPACGSAPKLRRWGKCYRLQCSSCGRIAEPPEGQVMYKTYPLWEAVEKWESWAVAYGDNTDKLRYNETTPAEDSALLRSNTSAVGVPVGDN